MNSEEVVTYPSAYPGRFCYVWLKLQKWLQPRWERHFFKIKHRKKTQNKTNPPNQQQQKSLFCFILHKHWIACHWWNFTLFFSCLCWAHRPRSWGGAAGVPVRRGQAGLPWTGHGRLQSDTNGHGWIWPNPAGYGGTQLEWAGHGRTQLAPACTRWGPASLPRKWLPAGGKQWINSSFSFTLLFLLNYHYFHLRVFLPSFCFSPHSPGEGSEQKAWRVFGGWGQPTIPFFFSVIAFIFQASTNLATHLHLSLSLSHAYVPQ